MFFTGTIFFCKQIAISGKFQAVAAVLNVIERFKFHVEMKVFETTVLTRK